MTKSTPPHRNTRQTIPVIDLFAGPGGLGEGFSAHAGPLQFDVALSIEKDSAAHRTLELRSFVRQFERNRLPEEYYSYVRGEGTSLETLLATYPVQAERARSIAWKAELGKEKHSQVYARVQSALGDTRHWVLLGGPPCQAYSVMGRARMSKMEKFATDHRHTLYREYLKIVAAFHPTVFVMENVKGILSSKHKDQDIFSKILADLRNPWNALSETDRKQIPQPKILHTYKIYSFSTPVEDQDTELESEDYIISSENYALPQKRHRVILFGIRSDYDIVPPVLEPVADTVTVRHILEGMPRLRSRLSRDDRNGYWWRAAIRGGVDVCTSECQQRLRGLGTVIRSFSGMLSDELGTGGVFVAGGCKPARLSDWLFDPMLGGVLQHEARSHMASDLHRYFFSACFAQKYGRTPTLEDFPIALYPEHKNAVQDEDGKVANFKDRFRVQTWNDAATTITSHIAKDGHYFIHPDPLQCRSLSVREAARLQTFPDNYFFEGNRTQQYHQIGNAVPPFLAYQLSDIVSEVISGCMKIDRRGTKTETRRRVIAGADFG